jgi:hypothetical protein
MDLWSLRRSDWPRRLQPYLYLFNFITYVKGYLNGSIYYITVGKDLMAGVFVIKIER